MNLAKQAWLGLAKLVAALGFVLFLPAWTLRFWQAWVFLGVFAAAAALITIDLQRRDPELLRRRLSAGAEKERSQKIIVAVARGTFLGIFVVAGLDHRLGWSRVPAAVVVGGDLLVIVGLALVFLVFRENSYTSAVVEVAAAQPVISTGPYAVIRHPMYTGGLLMVLGAALALGTYWALPLVLVMCAALVWRLHDEERFLSRQLPGYRQYASRVPYRLIPRVW